MSLLCGSVVVRRASMSDSEQISAGECECSVLVYMLCVVYHRGWHCVFFLPAFFLYLFTLQSYLNSCTLKQNTQWPSSQRNWVSPPQHIRSFSKHWQSCNLLILLIIVDELLIFILILLLRVCLFFPILFISVLSYHTNI